MESLLNDGYQLPGYLFTFQKIQKKAARTIIHLISMKKRTQVLSTCQRTEVMTPDSVFSSILSPSGSGPDVFVFAFFLSYEMRTLAMFVWFYSHSQNHKFSVNDYSVSGDRYVTSYQSTLFSSTGNFPHLSDKRRHASLSSDFTQVVPCSCIYLIHSHCHLDPDF